MLDRDAASVPYYGAETAALSELKGAIQLVDVSQASAFAGTLTITTTDRTWTLVARDPHDAERWATALNELLVVQRARKDSVGLADRSFKIRVSIVHSKQKQRWWW